MDTPTWNPYLIDMPAKSPLYDQDFFAWSRQQADLLRAGDLARADIEHIAEEIESLGRTEKRELINRLTVLLLHLLKWRYQPEKRGASWEASIRVQRNRLADHLEDNPSLAPLLPQARLSAYGDAALEAVADTGLPGATFPQACPWSDEQVLDAERRADRPARHVDTERRHAADVVERPDDRVADALDPFRERRLLLDDRDLGLDLVCHSGERAYTAIRGTRALTAQRTSYEIVPSSRASSSAVISPPMRTTSSPTWAPGTSVTSTMVMSMQTRPTTGARRPRTRTCALFESDRLYPSA